MLLVISSTSGVKAVAASEGLFVDEVSVGEPSLIECIKCTKPPKDLAWLGAAAIKLKLRRIIGRNFMVGESRGS